MGIKIEGNLFYIEAQTSSMIIEQKNSDLLLRHLGRKISQYHFSNRVHERDHAFSGNPDPNVRTYSYDTQRQILGTHGFGDFRQPALVLQHGNNALNQFKFTEARVIEGVVVASGLPNPYSAEGAETLELSLVDDLSQTRVKLYYTTYSGRDTLSTFIRIENFSKEKVILHRILSTMCDLPAAPYDVISLQGAYAREKTVRRQAVEQGTFSISSNRGASGHSQTPALILCEQEANDYYGESLALQLLYSGNFQAFVQQNQLNEIRLGIGINDENFAWELKPGETFDTPVALISYSDQGLTALSQESQSFVQSHIIPQQFADVERPILINNWEATYFDFQKDKLLQLADEASQLGMELFVLDDGWFGHRFDDNRALGDWWVNEEKLGGSLNQLIADIHAKGLRFGLWVEPEMISEDSNLYRKYPDWVIQAAGRSHTYSRNQLVLNFANPEVVEYIKLTFDDILRRHAIDYIKWDYNRNITNVGNGDTYLETQMQSHAYILGLYEVIDYLTKKHPQVLFESCSGGGGRNDLGMMRYFPQVWASDNTDAISRLSIQYGSSYLYPTISMGAHVSAVPNHQMGRVTPLKTRGHVAMMGNLGYELDLTKLSDLEKEEIANQVKRYKAIRPTVQKGRFYRLLNPSRGANEMAVQFNDDKQVVLTYVRILSTIETMETTLKLKGLDPDATYKLVDEDKSYSGAELMYAGLTMVLPQGDYLSKQLYFVKET
ncbi:alpha-galactosidase [Streptococcus dentasini]